VALHALGGEDPGDLAVVADGRRDRVVRGDLARSGEHAEERERRHGENGADIHVERPTGSAQPQRRREESLYGVPREYNIA
jgi:hypothetical protein